MEVSEHLKPLQSYIGKTYKGEFADSTPENPTYDNPILGACIKW